VKLMIMDHARHGKDTVCEILRDTYGFTFESSSMADAGKRVPAETTSSCTVSCEMADMLVDNNGSLQDLRWEVAGLVKILRDWRG